MKSKIPVTQNGVTVYISVLPTTKHGKPYTEYVISEYSTGKRVRHVRADRQAAEIKAKEIAKAMAVSRADVLGWSETERRDIHQALKLVAPLGVSVDRAAFIVAEAAKLVGVDDILSACQHWRNNRPDKPVSPKPVKDGAAAFLANQKERVSERRHKTAKCYVDNFVRTFGERNMHEVSQGDVEAWLEDKDWGPATINEVIGTVGLLYKYAGSGNRGWVSAEYNPVGKIVRRKVAATAIEIFEPWEGKQLLERIQDKYSELTPFLVLWCFSGCRKEEAARVTWQQLNAALKTGRLELRPDQTKTGQGRTMPLLDNARAWLSWWLGKYGEKLSGTVLPERWQNQGAIDGLPGLLSTNTGITWRDNACRHSFITYRCAVTDSVVNTADEAGNSPAKIERHYRRKAITKEQAQEWFSIMPPKPAENVVRLEDAA